MCIAGTEYADTAVKGVLHRFYRTPLPYAYHDGCNFAVSRKIQKELLHAAIHSFYDVERIGFVRLFANSGAGVNPLVSLVYVEVISPCGNVAGALLRSFLPIFRLDGDDRRVGPESDSYAGRTAYLKIFAFGKAVETRGIDPVIRYGGVREKLPDEGEFRGFVVTLTFDDRLCGAYCAECGAEYKKI